MGTAIFQEVGGQKGQDVSLEKPSDVALDRRRSTAERLLAIDKLAQNLAEQENCDTLESLLHDFSETVREHARCALFSARAEQLAEQVTKVGDERLTRELRELLSGDTPKSVLAVILGNLYRAASALDQQALRLMSLTADPNLARLASDYYKQMSLGKTAA